MCKCVYAKYKSIQRRNMTERSVKHVLCAINLKNVSFCILCSFFACAYYKIEGSAPSSKAPLVMSPTSV